MDKRKLLIAAFAALILIVAVLYINKSVSQDDYNARLDGHIFDITAKISGPITKVDVQEDGFVSKDFPLIEINAQPYIAELERIQNNILALEQGIPIESTVPSTNITQWENRIAQAANSEKQAVVESEKLSIELAKITLERRKAEINPKSKTKLQELVQQEQKIQQQLEQAKSTQEQLSLSRSKAEQELTAIKDQTRLLSTPQGMELLRQSELKTQQAALENAKENMANTVLVSPVEGYLLAVLAKPGMQAEPGETMVQIVPLDSEYLWVNAYFDEKEIVNFKVGQPCRIEITAMPELDLEGHILSIRAATAGVALQDDGFSDNFKNKNNMIPIKVSIDNYDPAVMPPVRLGMTATVTPL